MDQQSTYHILNEKLKDIPKAQIRSLSLSVLPRLMGALHKHKNSCPDCMKFQQEGVLFVNNVKQLFADDVKTMRQFESWVNQSQKHLKADHQLQVKGRLTATFTTIGMFLGIILPAIYVVISKGSNYIGYISLGWVIGMLAGYTAGKIKENGLQKHHKLY